MSVVFTQTPSVFQPVLSDNLYFVASADTTDTYRFRYVYDLYIEDELVFQGKCTPNPFGLGIIDIQQVLETYTFNSPVSYWNTTPIYTHQTFPFSRPSNDEVVNFYVVCGYEYADSPLSSVSGFTGIGTTQGEPAYKSGVFKTFRSTMGVNGNAMESFFNIGPFVLSGTPTTYNPTTSGLFLTNSPRTRRIDPSEYYTLGFTNYYMGSTTATTLSEPYYVKYTFYDSVGSEITATTYDNITTNGGGPRTSCNQVYQQLYLINPFSGTTDYNTLYVGCGPANIPNFPSNCVQYTVQLYGLFEGSTTPIQPTPTPTPTRTPFATTPTPTQTPSSTPQCSTCTEYNILYSGESEFGSALITGCTTGIQSSIKLTPGVYYTLCSCGYPTGSDLSITTVGPCSAPSPSPTPTKSPTPTPTPSGCNCNTYLVENTEPYPTDVEWIDCNTGPQIQYLSGYNTLTVCSCNTPAGSTITVSLLSSGCSE